MKKILLFFLLIGLCTTSFAQVTFVKDFVYVRYYEALGNKILFNENDQLWVSDGSTNGTFQIPSAPSFSQDLIGRCRVGNVIFYTNRNFDELWKTDGTITGTVKVKDGFSTGRNLVNLNGTLIFTTTTATGIELWRSDGTTVGTYQIVDLGGSNDGVTSALLKTAVYNGYLYFAGPSVAVQGYLNQPTLWKTDGTAAGTTQVANGGVSFAPQGMSVINNLLVYSAYYLYSYNCNNVVSTNLVKVIMKIDGLNPTILRESANITFCSNQLPYGNTFLNTYGFIKTGNYLYFGGQTEVVGGNSAYNLWRTDGTPQGTIQLTNFTSNPNGEGIELPFGSGQDEFNFSTTHYFQAKTLANGKELWRSDGTANGTYLLKDLNIGAGDSSPKAFIEVNGIVYFFASTPDGLVFKTDGSANGTQVLEANINSPFAGAGTNNKYVDGAAGNKFFFTGSSSRGSGLYYSCSSPIPTINASPSTQICSSSSVTLSASGCGGTINWSNGSNNSSITVSPSTNTSYSATCTESGCTTSLATSINVVVNPVPTITTNNNNLCTGQNITLTAMGVTTGLQWQKNGSVIFGANNATYVPTQGGTYRAFVTATQCFSNEIVVNTTPTAPSIIINNSTICSGNSATLTATGCAGTVTWSNAATGNSISVNTTGNYTATCTQNGCVSLASNSVSLIVNTAPSSPNISINNSTICSGSSATLTATGCAGTITWSNNATGNTTTVSTAGSYTATCTQNGCVSLASNSVSLTVNTSPAPSAPSISINNSAICSGNSATLTAAGCAGTTTWSNAATGSTTSVNTAGNYTATCTQNGCVSLASNSVSLIVNTTPSAPNISINNATICTGNSATLTATGCAGTITWSNNATGNTTTVSTAGNYTATCTQNGCVSLASNSVSLIVNTAPSPSNISINNSTICSGSSATLTATGCIGTITWSNAATGSTTSVNTTGNYTATCTQNGCVSLASNSVSLIVNTTPTAPSISINNSTICSGNSATLTATGCAGTVTWSNAATGSSISVNTAGNYTATCTLNSCIGAVSNSVSLAVNPTPSAPSISVNNATICTGNSATLTATGCAGTVTWSNNATGNTTAVSTAGSYTATCTINGCVSINSNSVSVNFSSNTTPSSVGAAICSGNYANLSTTGCSGIYKWYSSNSSSIILSSLNTYTTPILSSSTTYYISCTENSCEGARGISLVNVYALSDPACNAQNTYITAIEYFIDADPGYGSGTSVAITPDNPKIQPPFSITLPAGLADGFHFLSLRAKDANNKWSVVATRPFYKATLLTNSLPNIAAMEYFIDNDLGYGNGTSVAFTNANASPDFQIPISPDLADGFHFLSLRVKDMNNKWSVVAVRPFYKETRNTPATLTNVEYFIDNDPGTGNGLSVNLPNSILSNNSPLTSKIDNNLQALSGSSVAFTFSPNNLSNGLHKVSFRAKDANNKWGIVGIQDFVVQDNVIVTGTTPASWCKNSNFSIPFTATGTFTNGNIFTAQLSDTVGSFTSPTSLGTFTGTSSGTIAATIPNSVVLGTGYKIRIISSLPVITNSPQKMIDVTALCQCLLNASLITGNWGTAGIWSCGHIPLVTEPVKISLGHTITLDVNGAAKSLDLRGILNQPTTKILTIQGN